MLTKILNFISKQDTKIEPFSPAVLMQRELHISNLTFCFSMPENFSMDMPADDMTENVNLHDNEKLNTIGVSNILDRWWDYSVAVNNTIIKASTRFSIDIIKDLKSDSENTLNIEKLIKLEHEELEKFYLPINEKHITQGEPESTIFLPLYPEHYRTVLLNGTNWLNYTLSGSKAADFYLYPLAKNYYIKIGFHFSPHTHFLNCNELRNIMGSEVERVSNTFYLKTNTTDVLEQQP